LPRMRAALDDRYCATRQRSPRYEGYNGRDPAAPKVLPRDQVRVGYGSGDVLGPVGIRRGRHVLGGLVKLAVRV
jgi:hypothetical protein